MVYFNIGNVVVRSLAYMDVNAVLNRKTYPIGFCVDLRILQNVRGIMTQTGLQCLLLCTF